MNDEQAIQRIQTILQSGRWSGGAQDPIFHPGSVLTTPRPTLESLRNLTPPCAFIRPGSARVDPELRGMKQTDIIVTLVIAGAGDPYGESTLVGWNREEGKSGGMGILAVQSEVIQLIEEISINEGIEMKHVADSYPLPALDEATNYIIERDYTFKARLTSKARYQRPEAFTASLAGSTVNLAWAAPFKANHLGYSLVRVTGTTGLSSRTPGDEIDTPTSVTTSFADTPGSGIFTYSLFAGYHTQAGEVVTELFSDCPQVTVEVP